MTVLGFVVCWAAAVFFALSGTAILLLMLRSDSQMPENKAARDTLLSVACIVLGVGGICLLLRG